MKIIIKTKDLELTPPIEDYLRKRLQTLEKFLKNFDQELIVVEAELGRTTQHHKTGPVFRAEINLTLNGKMLRAEVEEMDLYAAIGLARDELETEIKSFKGKQTTLERRGARSIKKKFNISPLARFKKSK